MERKLFTVLGMNRLPIKDALGRLIVILMMFATFSLPY